ncbi:transporter [Sphingobium sp. TomMM35A]
MAKAMLLGLVLASVLLSAAAQLILKIGMSSASVQGVLAQPHQSIIRAAIVIGTSPLIILGLGCFVLSAVVWLLVLARVDLSTAYPFIGLGLVITVASSYFILGEPISATKLVGVASIVFGVVLIGLSASPTRQEEQLSGKLEQATRL